jgi:hypothetical protein
MKARPLNKRTEKKYWWDGSVNLFRSSKSKNSYQIWMIWEKVWEDYYGLDMVWNYTPITEKQAKLFRPDAFN